MVMGVSGVGKSAVGAAVAKALHLPFVDADDLHPAANRAKMAAGQPLTDEDRWPWLDLVAKALEAEAVLACSALKRRYRDHLRARIAPPLQIIHLTAPRALIAERLAARQGHFMPASLLDSQLATLEPPSPEEALTIAVDRPLAEVVAKVLADLQNGRVRCCDGTIAGRVIPTVAGSGSCP